MLLTVLLTPTFIYLYIYIYKKIKAGLDQITYILRQSEKKLNILTLAFSVGCIFTGVWHAMATDESNFIIPQDPSFESVLLAGTGWRAAFGFNAEMTNSLSDGLSGAQAARVGKQHHPRSFGAKRQKGAKSAIV